MAEVYFQVGPDSGRLRAQVDLLEAAISERCYDTLRTREQLGYAVHCGVRLTHAMLGFAFVVVSGEHPSTFNMVPALHPGCPIWAGGHRVCGALHLTVFIPDPLSG